MRIYLMASVLVLLAGCGSNGPFRDRGFDYLLAEAAAPLVYPEGLTPIPAQELYPVAGVEQRKKRVAGEKPSNDIPAPPQTLPVDAISASPVVGSEQNRKITESQVVLTRDGSDFPVLMLDLAFDWAWQSVGDVLKDAAAVKVEDLDRSRAVYFVTVDGKRSSAGDPYQLKLNYTSNGIQVALQVDENAMAPKDVAASLMQKLRDGLLR